MNLEIFKKTSLDSVWKPVLEGWHRVSESTSEALTRFLPLAKRDDRPPQATDQSDSSSWALLAGSVYENEHSIQVRLEIAGVRKEEMQIEVVGDYLVVSGEKHFESDHQDGQFRLMQCAFGRFERSVRLPAAVRCDGAKASYRDGVLTVTLPKAESSKPRVIDVPVH